MEKKDIFCKKNIEMIVKVVITYFVLVCVLYFFEKNHLLNSAVKDDLNSIKYQNSMGMFDAIFSHGYKFRPVSNFMMWLVGNVCGIKIYWYGYVNILYNAFCACIIFYLVKDCLKSSKAAVIAVGLYIFTRFSYYQITTMLGVMETTCTICGIIFVWCLYKYLDTDKNVFFYLGMLWYGMASLSHERYLVLMPVLLYICVVGRKDADSVKERIKKAVLVLAEFAIILLSFYLLVDEVMTGTGGTNVVSTFSISSYIYLFFQSIQTLFGINGVEKWLSMIAWKDYSGHAKLIVIISIVMVIIICILYLIELWKMKKEERIDVLKKTGLFILSCGALLVISSATIRVELRWLYYPYMVMVFLLLYMASLKRVTYTYWIKNVGLGVYVCCMIVFSLYCRGYYGNLYYWPTYTVGNSLIECSYGRYGMEMYDRNWVLVTDVVIETPYQDIMDQFDLDVERDLNVEIVPTMKDLPDITGKEVLYFDKEIWQFVDVTESLNEYNSK